MKIHLDAPNLGELEKEYLARCVDENFVSTAGPFVPEFEQKFSSFVGAKYAVAVQSGTAALHLALNEAGIGPGDEVIVPALTFAATANVVIYAGATPVFADSEPDTWNLDPDDVRRRLTPSTKAIIPVHLLGNPCNMDALCGIASDAGIAIIEDATESLGASWNGKQTGTFGSFGCFSFNGNKIITTGGGGMIVAGDEAAAEHIRFLANQARDANRGYYHPEVGFNFRMTNIEAALGLAQIQRLPGFLERKRETRRTYIEALEGVDGVEFQMEKPEADPSWWLVSATFDNVDVEKLASNLSRSGIPTRRMFVPLVEFPQFKKYASGDYRNSYHIYEKGLSLPSSTLNEKQGIESVAAEVKRILAQETAC